LTVRHTRDHLTRAVLEGVAFGLRDSFELMKGAGLASIDQVRISGGGTRSPVWRQIIADVLGVELVTVNTAEGGAYGAALLGATGAGQFASVEEACQQVISITGSTAPGKNKEIYEEIYPTYREIYPALKPIFHR
jgi:xylulokinase